MNIAAACLIAILLMLFIPPRIARMRVDVPPGAAEIGPNGYMRAWVEDGRVVFVFRRMPHAKVLFDKRAVPELVHWMQALEEAAP